MQDHIQDGARISLETRDSISTTIAGTTPSILVKPPASNGTVAAPEFAEKAGDAEQRTAFPYASCEVAMLKILSLRAGVAPVLTSRAFGDVVRIWKMRPVRPGVPVLRVAWHPAWARSPSGSSVPAVRTLRAAYFSPMARSDTKLLDEIERAAVDADGDIAVALRKCLILGGTLRSPELRDWATRELRGYEDADAVPPYRIVPAQLVLDGADVVKMVKGQEISPAQLPDFARDDISEQLDMTQPIGKIEDTIRDVRRRQANDGTIAYGIQHGSSLAAYMTHEARQRGDFTTIQRIYKTTHVTELVGIVEQVRVRLTELIAELRAGMHDGALTEGEARHAVSVAIGGNKNRVVVNAPSEGSDVIVLRDSEGWGWKAWALVCGLATIAGLVLTVLATRG